MYKKQGQVCERTDSKMSPCDSQQSVNVYLPNLKLVHFTTILYVKVQNKHNLTVVSHFYLSQLVSRAFSILHLMSCYWLLTEAEKSRQCMHLTVIFLNRGLNLKLNILCMYHLQQQLISNQYNIAVLFWSAWFAVPILILSTRVSYLKNTSQAFLSLR